jgi:hypothetical protein
MIWVGKSVIMTLKWTLESIELHENTPDTASFGSMNWKRAIFMNFTLPNEDFGRPNQPSGTRFRSIFKGVSTLFGLRIVEKCFENALRTVGSAFQNLRLGSINLPNPAWRFSQVLYSTWLHPFVARAAPYRVVSTGFRRPPTPTTPTRNRRRACSCSPHHRTDPPRRRH